MPIVARLPGTAAQAIQEGITGITVAPDDVSGFVAAIATMTDPQRWGAFSTAGRHLIRQHFTLQRMGRSYLQLFHALAQGEYALSLRRADLPAPFTKRDYVPLRLLRLFTTFHQFSRGNKVVRYMKEQQKSLRQLLRYGLRRKLQGSWLGLRTYWQSRTLPQPANHATGKTILVFDYRILRPEDSTLGRSNDLYSRLLQAQGWRVLLMPYAAEWDGHRDGAHGLKWDDPYAVQLRQQGMIVLSGWPFRWLRASWLQRNAPRLDYVLFRHAEPAEAYLPLLRRAAQTKLIYLAPDLKAVRCQREYEATGKIAAWREAQAVAAQEAAIFQAADALLTRSDEEQEWLTARYGSKVFRMPLFFYPTLPVAQPILPAGQTLFFVGNFAHRPNPDGVHWFVRDCLPLLIEQCPQVNLVLAGSFAQADIFALQSARIKVLGRVSDQQLFDLYRQARVVIVPLRFGAGVKGKVIEALAHGVPVVTTRFGVEGVAGLTEITPPADTPQAMAAAITRLLTDDAEWRRVALAGQAFVQENFTLSAAQATLMQLFASLEK